MTTSLLNLFTESVKKFPDRIALQTAQEAYTYQDLDLKSNQLANQLSKEAGIAESDVIAITLSDKVWEILSVLAILKLNATYLPIDIDTPEDRILRIMNTAKCRHRIVGNQITNTDAFKLININNTHSYSSLKIPEYKKTQSPAYVIFTSGSTGTPKGVLMQHAGPYNTVTAMDDFFALTPEDSLIHNVSMSFDPSVWLVFWPLMHGAKIIIPYSNKDTDHLIQLAEKYQVRVLHAGPALFSGLSYSSEFNKLGSLELVIGGGQAWQLTQLKLLSSKLPNCGFCNVYGPTEASIHATAWQVSAASLKNIKQVSIGKPIKHMHALIMNDQLQRIADGETGELCLSGVGLAEGYINQPELTNEVFICTEGNRRVYKTGDKAKIAPDGNITFLGRIDDQVQIRGYRVELPEIEKVLSEAPNIQQATVIVDHDKITNNLKLHAFIVGNSTSCNNLVSDTKEFLLKKLPEYMCPSTINQVDDIPLNANSKPDKKVLLGICKQNTASCESAKTSLENELQTIWMQVLEKDAGVNDDFFDMGGDSLDALRLVASINNQLNTSLSVMNIFDYSTVSALAKYIYTLNKKDEDNNETAIETRNANNKHYCLSDNQEWLIALANGSKTINNVVIPLQITGKVDTSLLKSAIYDLVKAHDILRANITSLSSNELHFRKHPGEIYFERSIETQSKTDQETYIKQAMDQINKKQVNLTSDPLFTTHLIHTSHTNCILLIYTHHIVSDPTSANIIIEQIFRLYDNLKHNIHKKIKPTQFGEFLIDEKENQAKNNYPALLNATADKYIQNPGWINYANTDTTDRKAGYYRHTLSNQLSELANDFCKTRKITHFSFFLSLFSQSLYEIYQQPNFNIGINISRRHLSKYSSMIGPCSEQAVILYDTEILDSFTSTLASVHMQLNDIFTHQHLSLWKICKQIEKTKPDFTPNMLFNTLFDYESKTPTLAVGNLEITPSSVPPSEKMRRHLTMRISEVSNKFQCQIRYRESMFSQIDIEHLVSTFIHKLLYVTNDLALHEIKEG